MVRAVERVRIEEIDRVGVTLTLDWGGLVCLGCFRGDPQTKGPTVIHAYEEGVVVSSIIPYTCSAPLRSQGESERSGETWRVVAGGGGGNHHAQGVGLMHPRGSLYVVERVVR